MNGVYNLLHKVDLDSINLKEISLDLPSEFSKMIILSIKQFILRNKVHLNEIKKHCSIHRNSVRSQEIRLLMLARSVASKNNPIRLTYYEGKQLELSILAINRELNF